MLALTRNSISKKVALALKMDMAVLAVQRYT